MVGHSGEMLVRPQLSPRVPQSPPQQQHHHQDYPVFIPPRKRQAGKKTPIGNHVDHIVHLQVKTRCEKWKICENFIHATFSRVGPFFSFLEPLSCFGSFSLVSAFMRMHSAPVFRGCFDVYAALSDHPNPPFEAVPCQGVAFSLCVWLEACKHRHINGSATCALETNRGNKFDSKSIRFQTTPVRHGRLIWLLCIFLNLYSLTKFINT